MDPIERKQWERELIYLDPVAANGRLQVYGLWLFSAASTITALVALLGLAGITAKDEGVRALLIWSIIMFGLTLLLAGGSLVPLRGTYKLHNATTAHAAVHRGLKTRSGLLTAASFLFGLAIFLICLAGLSGLRRVAPPSRRLAYHVVNVSDSAGGKRSSIISAQFAVSRGLAGERIALEIDTGLTSIVPIATALATAGDSGVTDVKFSDVTIDARRGERCVRLVASIRDASGKAHGSVDTVAITPSCSASVASHPTE